MSVAEASALAVAGAAAPWASRSAASRARALFDLADLLERDSEAETASRGVASGGASVSRAVATLRWYAGWADKITAVAGTVNPIAGSHRSVSTPRPVGAVAVCTSNADPLDILSGVVAPALAAGNAVLVLSDDARGAAMASRVGLASAVGSACAFVGPIEPAVVLRFANVSTFDAFALVGLPKDAVAAIERAAASTMMQTVHLSPERDVLGARVLSRVLAFTETRTIWSTVGS